MTTSRSTPPSRRMAVAAAVLAAGGLALAAPAASRLWASRDLARRAVPYEQLGAPGAPRLLVLGDSTAAGTGASDARLSVPGLVGRARPHWSIENRGRNGARVRDLAGQFAEARAVPDLVLVMAGGNDVLRGTPPTAVEADLRRLLLPLYQRGVPAFVLPCGDLGHSQLLAPLSRWMHRRTAAFYAGVLRATAGLAQLVDMRMPAEADPFVQRPETMHAADGLHPSDAGYATWFGRLEPLLPRM